ncbi:DNA mismatch repair protein pms2, putative [Entamoeba dispar SAW760]|uniref:DNA mismatch repair protein pms2, putative n=1 Tax=Entamoeba dispar (strain ATCC PRA-260 / SAW760) TaxID=370354 RepID=B0E887_ENTDS|nr:DNA mismatch repair protein pms2, putative [Entamoeba dispar SAW760]EDR29212.1 DNA mismatch repair protein pms2, putative [Entamoeba dispar SAW760]|eukprot:EDR29212.1 DNA mismatch repair protein pms2, putative [Entamoeba dispar SAW760]
MTTIHIMNEEIIQKLSSGCVVIDCESVIKELVENAIDSGATIINIKLNNYGLDSIIVEDNGSGINEENMELLGKRHCTSKINNIEELTKVNTYGFRGEALYCISNMGEVEIISSEGKEIGNSIQLTTRIKKRVTRKQGTTIIVKKLFMNNKIRREEFMRNKNKELSKIITLIQNYALMLINIKIILIHQFKKSNNILLQSNGKSLKENLYNLFKIDAKDVTIPIEIEENGIKISGIVSNFIDKGRTNNDRIFLFVNKRPIEHKKLQQIIIQQWRSLGISFKRKYPTVILNILVDEYDPNVSPDKRKVFFINEDNVLKLMEKCISSVWSTELLEQNIPTINNDISYSTSSIIENTSPIKSFNISFLPQSTQNLINQRKQKIISQNIFDKEDINNNQIVNEKQKEKPLITIHQLKNENESIEDEIISSSIINTNILQQKKNIQNNINENQNEISEIENKEDDNDEWDDILKDESSLENSLQKIRNFSSKLNEKKNSEEKELDERKVILKEEKDDYKKIKEKGINEEEYEIEKKEIKEIEEKKKNLIRQKTEERMNKINNTIIISEKINEEIEKENNLKKQIKKDDDKKIINIRNKKLNKKEQEEIKENKELNYKESTSISEEFNEKILEEEEKENKENKEENIKINIASNKLIIEPIELKRIVEHMILCHKDYPICQPERTEEDILKIPRKMKKTTLEEIEIIGQFNKGFIIGKLGYDLYIIDQHAADEIYNYETLLKKDKLSVQTLISPLQVTMSCDDEIFVQENIELFTQFGFEVIFREDKEVTQRVFLTKVYHRGKNFFGINEFSELVQQLKGCRNDMKVIVKKKHKIFATEACRMSIMIGDSLGREEMKKIIKRLVELNKPWHCPHGRQTIRHLWDLRRSFNEISKETK